MSSRRERTLPSLRYGFGGRWGRIYMRNERQGKHSHPNHSFTYLIQTESDRALMTHGSRLECIKHSFREIWDKRWAWTLLDILVSVFPAGICWLSHSGTHQGANATKMTRQIMCNGLSFQIYIYIYIYIYIWFHSLKIQIFIVNMLNSVTCQIQMVATSSSCNHWSIEWHYIGSVVATGVGRLLLICYLQMLLVT